MMRSLAAAATMVATVILLGAVLLRWREIGWEALVWLAAFVMGVAIRTPHAVANRANRIVAARKDMTEHVLLFAMFAAMMVLPMLHLASGVFAFANYRLPVWAGVTGAVLQIPYLWLFWRSHADLGRNWSPGLEVRDAHSLITTGVSPASGTRCTPPYGSRR